MSAMVYVNGRISDAATASVPVFDHGFLYGEGVYETLRTYDRVPFLFDRHMARLRQSASLMALRRAVLGRRSARARRRDDRGAPGAGERRGLHPHPADARRRRTDLQPGRDARCRRSSSSSSRFPRRRRARSPRASACRSSSVRRNHPQALNPMIKSNNLLNNALAMQEALRQGGEEALMQNQAGELVECSQSNFFMVRDGSGADAAARRRTAARHHARVRAGACRRAGHSRPRDARYASRSRHGGRSLHHRHDARSHAGRRRSTRRAIGSGRPGPDHAAVARSDFVRLRRTTSGRSKVGHAIQQLSRNSTSAVRGDRFFVRFDRRARAHEIAVAVRVVDARDRRPELVVAQRRRPDTRPARVSRRASTRRR